MGLEMIVGVQTWQPLIKRNWEAQGKKWGELTKTTRKLCME